MNSARKTLIWAWMALALAALPGYGQQLGDKEYAPQVGQSGKDVIWVPTPQEVVEKMLQMARITPEDFVIDLGSGDGRIAIAAAKKFGARSMGVEFNPDMVALSTREAQRQGVADKVKFVNADIFQTDFSQATIITMYLLPDLNLKLRPKLLELKPGTRIASHQFTMGEWQPDETATLDGRQALMWIVPARVEGTWALRIDDKAQDRPLAIRQSFQMLSVQFNRSNATLAFADGRVRGDQVSFTIADASVRREFSGRIQGNTMYGTVRAAGAPEMRWTATLR